MPGVAESDEAGYAQRDNIQHTAQPSVPGRHPQQERTATDAQRDTGPSRLPLQVEGPAGVVWTAVLVSSGQQQRCNKAQPDRASECAAYQERGGQQG